MKYKNRNSFLAQNRNPRWRPSAILDLLHHHIGPPTKSLHWAKSACQFFANPVHRFEGTTIWIFCRFGLKCLLTPKKIWFLGVWTPKRDWSSSRPPKGTSLAGTACKFWYKSVHWCDLGACWRNQKKRKKARKETYSGKLGVRLDHPRWRSDIWSCCRVVFGR